MMMAALRRAGQRLRLTGGSAWIPRAGYAESRGVLSEEEKAVENMYIKKMEQERMEKARMKAELDAASHTSSSESATPKPAELPKPDPDLSTKSIAMGAALVAVLCGVYFMVSSPPSGKKTSETKAEEES